MTTYSAVGEGATPPWWRTASWVLLIGFTDLFPLVFSPVGWGFQQNRHIGSSVLLTGGLLLLAVALPICLVWRHRFPFRIALGSAALSMVLPLGSGLPLLSLAALIGRRRGPAVWWSAGAVAASVVWVAVADALAQPKGASLIKTWVSDQNVPPSQPVPASATEVAVIILVALGASVGLGVLARSRREAASAKHAVQTERAASGRLGDEVARRQERERVAREVHDALGHRLSLLNLHAGALEANAAGDPQAAESARLVREAAGAAMDDLRSLLGLLRDPDDAALPTIPLAKLGEMIRESFGAGQALSSSVLVQDPDSAHPTLTRAVYRIVQELLTNARKHAPGQMVFLSVEGGPASGIVIDCRNPYIGGWGDGAAGEARGLTGVTERAELLSGRASYGLDEGGRTFRVHVDLPWRVA